MTHWRKRVLQNDVQDRSSNFPICVSAMRDCGGREQLRPATAAGSGGGPVADADAGDAGDGQEGQQVNPDEIEEGPEEAAESEESEEEDPHEEEAWLRTVYDAFSVSARLRLM